jgi:hypothetical protein
MKQIVRYSILTIVGKVRVEVRINVEDGRNPEYITSITDKNIALSLNPTISILISHPDIIDESGTRTKVPWSINDCIMMTKQSMAVFLNELATIQQELKTPELYEYTGNRLELNEEIASKIRKVFMIATSTIELSAVVIVPPGDEKRVEGIKMKFNNEHSSVLLTLNEIEALVYALRSSDIDSIAIALYFNYIKSGNIRSENLLTPKVDVDILPKI